MISTCGTCGLQALLRKWRQQAGAGLLQAQAVVVGDGVSKAQARGKARPAADAVPHGQPVPNPHLVQGQGAAEKHSCFLNGRVLTPTSDLRSTQLSVPSFPCGARPRSISKVYTLQVNSREPRSDCASWAPVRTAARRWRPARGCWRSPSCVQRSETRWLPARALSWCAPETTHGTCIPRDCLASRLCSATFYV